MQSSFLAYSDESGTFDHQYQSIAVVSGSNSPLNQLRSTLRDIVQDHGISEFKFYEIQGYQSVQAKVARQFIQHTVKDFIVNRNIRIDVLTWDLTDSRHDIPNRDDVSNLRYMYYKVLLHVARQWNQAKWSFYPDNNSKIPWGEIRSYLSISSLVPSGSMQNLLIDFSADNNLFEFVSIDPLDSIQEPLIQLGDLFAGLSRFTAEERERCTNWLAAYGCRQQLRFKSLCSLDGTIRRRSKSTRTKECLYQLVGSLDNLCKKHKLRVSLRKNNRLWTPNRSYPINFWNYEPQGMYDKAPTKS